MSKALLPSATALWLGTTMPTMRHDITVTRRAGRSVETNDDQWSMVSIHLVITLFMMLSSDIYNISDMAISKVICRAIDADIHSAFMVFFMVLFMVLVIVTCIVL